ncbi:helix-turn-helix domain-containing protein [Epilithonimonas zeae]|uniref:helix-turn-helix domain-containing protein n=1 Tax=Epilithonimonas zeae TaxID=1416779 RepID=UPI0015881459|nr:AraC family transcriptional regulator [Epilithonimonas zeae]
MKKNDERALPYVHQYIAEAKKQNDFKYLAQGFKDAIFYSADEQVKLMYADSTIIAALKTKDNDLISNAYLGKGIIYYFNFKQFEQALNEYLKAYQYIEKSNDLYQINKVKYHLGVVKSYLGFFDEALDLFTDCNIYFKEQLRTKKHLNLRYNDEKGYLNSLHQMIICYRNLKKNETADSLIDDGLRFINDRKTFSLEQSYLLKCKGISEFYKSNYTGAKISLKKALPQIIKAKDFSWEAVIYYYLGKTYSAGRSDVKAVRYFEKVDSIFTKTSFILPELRICYEDLINYNHRQKDFRNELYYTKQLLKVDSILGKNFSYLSPKIHRQYDKQSLLKMKEELEQKANNRTVIALLTVLLSFSIILILVLKYRKEKFIASKYRLLYEKLNRGESEKQIKHLEKPEIGEHKKSILKPELLDVIAEKIQFFEQHKIFLQKGITLSVLAQKLDTNTYYLSSFINETFNMNFSQYLNHLRINYITELLFNDKRFLNYTVEALAEECGMASRQSFSDIFFEINGIRPADFIKNRLQQLKSDTL